MKKIAIIGAGITGLALGWYLKKKYGDSIDLTLFEKEKRAGGWIRTVRQEGFLFELGPRSCRPKGPGIEVLRLIEELGLQDQVITAAPDAHKRYLYTDKTLREIPNSLLGLLTSPLMQGMPKALWRDWFAKPQALEDESIYDFIARRFSSEIAERFVDPLTSGIYAGNIRHLSLKSCFPKLHEWEQLHGSVLKGMLFGKKTQVRSDSDFVQRLSKESLYSFKGGMQVLSDALAHQLSEHILYSTEIDALTEMNSGIEFQFKDGRKLWADHVFATIPAHRLAKILSPSPFAAKLNEIPATTVGVVNLGFEESVLERKGFGYLVPRMEGEDILGMVWDSCIFPQQNQSDQMTRLTVMIGGANKPLFHQLESEDLLKIAFNAIANHLNIKSLPAFVHIHKAHQAIPQYTLGHAQRVLDAERLAPRALTLLGSSYRGVSVNDCIFEAKLAAFG